MARYGTIAVLLANVALGVANLAVFVQARARAAAPSPPTEWERWQACSPAERHSFVERYQALEVRDDAAVILRHAREFSRLAAAEQERVRSLARLLATTLENEAAGGRRELLRTAPRAQAYFVYQVLAADPARLAALRAEWSPQP